VGATGVLKRDDGWRIPDELWNKIEPLLPLRPELMRRRAVPTATENGAQARMRKAPARECGARVEARLLGR
jgi:hypothetical protein